MAQVALVIYVVWAGGAFGVRSFLHRRRTGDSGLRLYADPMTPAWWAKIGLVVAAAVGLAGPIAGLLGVQDLPFLQFAAVRVIGVSVAIAGAASTFWVQAAMGASFSRNPILTATTSTALG